MNKVICISLNGATKGQINKQFELRVSRIKSEKLREIAEHFLNRGVKRQVDIEEIKSVLECDREKAYSMIAQLPNHGFEIINHSARGQSGLYQLVGFTYRNCDQEKKVIEASDKKQRLINSVFC